MAVPYVGIQASWDKCSINTCREINPHIGVVLQWCIVHPRQNVRERNGRSPTRKCELVICRASTQVYTLVRIIECQTKKNKKKYNAHYDKTQMHRKTWERWTQGRPWLVIDNLGVMKCTLCTEHEVTSRNFIVGCPSHKAESITFHEKSRAHKKAEILLILLFVELKNVNARE